MANPNPILREAGFSDRVSAASTQVAPYRALPELTGQIETAIGESIASKAVYKASTIKLADEILKTQLEVEPQFDTVAVAQNNKILATNQALNEALAPDVLQDELEALTAQLYEQTEVQSVREDELLDLRETTIEEDGFFAALGALAQIPGQKHSIAEADRAAERTAVSIDRLREATSDTGKTVRQVEDFRTEAIIDQGNDALIAQAQIDKAKRAAAAKAGNVAALEAGFNADDKQLKTLISAQATEVQRLQVSASQRRLDKEKASMEAITEGINRFREEVGKPALAVEAVEASLFLGGDAADRLTEQFDMGINLIETGSPGTDYGESVQRDAVYTDRLAMNTPMNVAHVANQETAITAAAAQNMDYGKLPAEAQQQFLNEAAVDAIEADTKKAKRNEGGVYDLMPYKTLADSAVISEDEVHQKIIAPLKLEKTDINLITNTVGRRIARKEITFEEGASYLNKLVNFGVYTNNTVNQYTRNHYPAQEKFPVYVNVTPATTTGLLVGTRVEAFGLVKKEELMEGTDYNSIMKTLIKIVTAELGGKSVISPLEEKSPEDTAPVVDTAP